MCKRNSSNQWKKKPKAVYKLSISSEKKKKNLKSHKILHILYFHITALNKCGVSARKLGHQTKKSYNKINWKNIIMHMMLTLFSYEAEPKLNNQQWNETMPFKKTLPYSNHHQCPRMLCIAVVNPMKINLIVSFKVYIVSINYPVWMSPDRC